jgi:hypothetical protein
MDLIRLEFNSGKTKITAMPTTIASSRFTNKPELLGRDARPDVVQALVRR